MFCATRSGYTRSAGDGTSATLSMVYQGMTLDEVTVRLTAGRMRRRVRG